MGRFYSLSNARTNHCWIFLHASILATLLTLSVGSNNSECESELKVPRGTHHEAVVGGNLKINCTVAFCSSSPPKVTWIKLGETAVAPVDFNRNPHIKTEWEMINPTEGISYLVFQNILRNDSALYRCGNEDSVSHSINITVIDHSNRTIVTSSNTSDATRSQGTGFTHTFWMYVYCGAGILAFVIIVIVVSVAVMRGCKGKRQKEMAPDNQYMVIPMCEQPSPHPSVQPPQRASPSSHHTLPRTVSEPDIYSVPARRSTRKKMRPSQPHDNEHLCDSTEHGGQRTRNTGEEEGRSLVYAALNHQVLPGAPARSRRPKEESSEYAAIRVS